MKQDYEELKDSLQNLLNRHKEYTECKTNTDKIMSLWGKVIDEEKYKFNVNFRNYFANFNLEVKITAVSRSFFYIYHTLISEFSMNPGRVGISDLEVINDNTGNLNLTFYDIKPDRIYDLVFLTPSGGGNFFIKSMDFIEFMKNRKT